MSKVTFSVGISRKSVARLTELMTAKNLTNYGEVCDASLNYPKGTFELVEEPVYDGEGCVVRLMFDFRCEQDLEVLAQRRMFGSVTNMFNAILNA